MLPSTPPYTTSCWSVIAAVLLVVLAPSRVLLAQASPTTVDPISTGESPPTQDVEASSQAPATPSASIPASAVGPQPPRLSRAQLKVLLRDHTCDSAVPDGSPCIDMEGGRTLSSARLAQLAHWHPEVERVLAHRQRVGKALVVLGTVLPVLVGTGMAVADANRPEDECAPDEFCIDLDFPPWVFFLTGLSLSAAASAPTLIVPGAILLHRSKRARADLRGASGVQWQLGLTQLSARW